jgi:hypothetical protein
MQCHAGSSNFEQGRVYAGVYPNPGLGADPSAFSAIADHYYPDEALQIGLDDGNWGSQGYPWPEDIGQDLFAEMGSGIERQT